MVIERKPKLIILVGIPASGKDTWARDYIKINPNTIMYSSDEIRKELYGDENIQGEPSKIFSLMRSRTIQSLHADQDVIYNATNVNFKDRKGIIAEAKNRVREVNIEAVILATPIEICKMRNKQRERKVPDYVYDKMISRWQTPFAGEGFDNISVVCADETLQKYFHNYYLEKIMAFGDQKNPHHTLTLADHCWKCMNLLFREEEEMYGNFFQAGFWHDAGKIFTQSFDDEGIAHYYSHEAYSSWIALSIGLPLLVAQAINFHMLPYNYLGGEQTWRKRLGEDLWSYIEKLHKADVEAH